MVVRVVKARASRRSAFLRGARTVANAIAETNLSRQELFALMDAGRVRWFAHGGRGTRFIAWGDLVDYLDELDRRHEAGAGVRT